MCLYAAMAYSALNFAHGCCRKVESKLAEEQSAAQAAAEEAASRLLGVEQAATEDKERLQQQLALLEQKLSEASAVQDDLATRLQVRYTAGQVRPMSPRSHRGAKYWNRGSSCPGRCSLNLFRRSIGCQCIAAVVSWLRYPWRIPVSG